MKKKTFILAGIVVICTVLSVWVGWYGTALGLGILGAWFGVELWKIARLDTKVLLLLVAEVILIWLAFSLAYLEMTSDLSDALSLSMQHLLHFDFINISNDLSDSLLFRALAAFEGLVGYLLIVSGVVLLIQKETKTS